MGTDMVQFEAGALVKVDRRMGLIEWLGLLDRAEAEYCTECVAFWLEGGVGVEPAIPSTVGRAKAKVLLYHTKSLLEDFKYKVKKIKKQTKAISLRIPANLDKMIKIQASVLQVSESELIRVCVELAMPMIRSNPRLLNFF